MMALGLGPGSSDNDGQRTILVRDYHLQPSDTIEISFPFSPEYNQTVAVQPDGRIALKEAAPVQALGATLAELSQRIRDAYQGVLRDPKVYTALKDYQKPSFYADGEVGHPGRYELRSDTTLMEALSEAGGWATDRARKSRVIVYRPQANGTYQVNVVDMKAEQKRTRPFEDYRILPGDVIFVPQNKFSKFSRFIPTANVGATAVPAY
jgi:polysaccharide export outer membrane protein